MLDDILNKTQEDNQDFGNLKFFLKKTDLLHSFVNKKTNRELYWRKKHFERVKQTLIKYNPL
jgi:hypothetical protein